MKRKSAWPLFFFIFFLWALHGKSCFYGFCNPDRTVCPLPSAWCLCSSVWCCLSEDAHWELSLNFTYSKYYLLSLSKERQDCCFLLTVLQLSSFLLLLLLHRSLLVTGVLLGEVKVAIPVTLKSKIRKLGNSYLRDSYLKSWFTVLSCWTVCSCPDAFTVFALFFFFFCYVYWSWEELNSVLVFVIQVLCPSKLSAFMLNTQI